MIVRQWRKQFELQAQVVVERVLDLREVDGVRDISEGLCWDFAYVCRASMCLLKD